MIRRLNRIQILKKYYFKKIFRVDHETSGLSTRLCCDCLQLTLAGYLFLDTIQDSYVSPYSVFGNEVPQTLYYVGTELPYILHYLFSLFLPGLNLDPQFFYRVSGPPSTPLFRVNYTVQLLPLPPSTTSSVLQTNVRTVLTPHCMFLCIYLSGPDSLSAFHSGSRNEDSTMVSSFLTMSPPFLLPFPDLDFAICVFLLIGLLPFSVLLLSLYV